MKTLFILNILLMSSAFAGLLLSDEELVFRAKKEHWTFNFENPVEPFATGRVDAPKTFNLPTKEFKKEPGPFPGKLDLRDKAELSPVKDQGSCGSCVYFATTAAFEDELRLRNMKTETLSPQWLMSCAAREWMCAGSFFEKVAAGLVAKGGQALESDYPYTASSALCKSKDYKLYGKAVGYKIIDNSPKSIIGALNDLHPVLTTIGAGGAMMSYRGGGVMNACQGYSTNHEMEIIGYSCETSIDASGNCKFDAQGKLPKGVGFWIIKNSWGVSYGDKGYLYIKMTNSGGALCNNVTEEVGILDTGVEPTPPGPVGKDFSIETDVASVKGTVKAAYVSFYDNIVKVITEFLNKFKG